jgi:DNA-binding beta-propeller fold protein YncE
MKSKAIKKLVLIVLTTTALALAQLSRGIVVSQESTQTQANPAAGELPAMNATNEVELEVVAALPIRPSAVVRTPDGRIIWTEHFGAPNPNKVHELLPDGTFRDYPAGAPYESHSLRIDSNGVLWMLDMGGNGKLPKLVGWDTKTETLVKEIEISPPVYEPNSSLQDFVIDEQNNQAIIADTGGGFQPWQFDPALVVVDLNSGESRRVLQEHSSVQAEPLDTLIEGKPLMLTIDREKGTQIPSRWGVNGIAIDPAQEWVYYAPMTGTSVYRISARDLANATLNSEALGKRVEHYGDKNIGDGLMVDGAGNVYNTDLQYNAIGITNAEGEYRLIRRDDKLLNFTEGFEPAADGYVYVATNQAHKSIFFQPVDAGVPPYYLLRFRPLAPAR